MPYPQRYVAFLDILGFSEIVRNTDKDALPNRFDALVKTLNEINSRENELDDVVGITVTVHLTLGCSAMMPDAAGQHNAKP